jgi:cryptochrome
MWREYNYLMGYSTPNFHQMADNPVMRQIPWDDDPQLLNVWENSQTGYPFIDALMTQFRETGFLHHLGRHAVACFLTRGDLWQSWEKGAEVFEYYLVDADWSINNFNWQCKSGSFRKHYSLLKKLLSLTCVGIFRVVLLGALLSVFSVL